MGSTVRRQPLTTKLPTKNNNTNFLNITQFGGLNVTDNPLNVPYSTASDSLNMFVDENNALSTRPRTKLKSTLNTSILSDFSEFVEAYPLDKGYLILYKQTNNKYGFARVVGTTVTKITGVPTITQVDDWRNSVVFEQNDMIYIIGGVSEYKQINSANVMSKADGYVPLRYGAISEEDGAKFEEIEPLNLLTGYYDTSYFWDGISVPPVKDTRTLNNYYQSVINPFYTTDEQILATYPDGTYISKNSYWVDDGDDWFDFQQIDCDYKKIDYVNLLPTNLKHLHYSGKYCLEGVEISDYTSAYITAATEVKKSFYALLSYEYDPDDFSSVYKYKLSFTVHDFETDTDEYFNINIVDATSTLTKPRIVYIKVAPNGSHGLVVISHNNDSNFKVWHFHKTSSGYAYIDTGYTFTYGVGERMPMINCSNKHEVLFCKNSTKYRITNPINDWTTITNTAQYQTQIIESDLQYPLPSEDYVSITMGPDTNDDSSGYCFVSYPIGTIFKINYSGDNEYQYGGFAGLKGPLYYSSGKLLMSFESPLNEEYYQVGYWPDATKIKNYYYINPKRYTTQTDYITWPENQINGFDVENKILFITAFQNRIDSSFWKKVPIDIDRSYNNYIEFMPYVDSQKPLFVVRNFMARSDTQFDTLEKEIMTFRKSKLSIRFDNERWFASGNKLFYTANNDPTYIPINNYIELGDGDEEIRGFNLVNDKTLVVYKRNRLYTITPTTIDGKYTYYITETKNTVGEDGFDSAIVTSYSEIPVQVTYQGIYGLKQLTNVASEDRISESLSDGIAKKWQVESQWSIDRCVSLNRTYWTMFCLPIENKSITHVYLLDNRTQAWFYWELPINLRCGFVKNDEVFLFDRNGDVLTLTLEDILTYHDTKYYDHNGEIIQWYWLSQILPLGTINYSKKLLKTTFIMADDDAMDNYGVNYQFYAYRKMLFETNPITLSDDIQIVQSVTKSTLIPRFKFLQFKLSNVNSDDADNVSEKSVNKIRLLGIGFKYMLLEGIL